jgi:2-C-methyl-D-erythritol 4-phosphate cytidylyltransferase
MAEIWGIVLAAGAGARFGGWKQFAEVGGRRLVDRVVALAHATCDGVVLVLPAGARWTGAPVDASVVGGATRSQSARRGLALVPSSADIVVEFDPAHPLVTRDLVDAVVRAIEAGADAAIPALPLAETLKRVDGRRVLETVDREGLVMTQAPLAFRAEVLRRVHREETEVVEDTIPVEAWGGVVTIVPGDPRNLHVTRPEDLDIVARLLDEHDP